jgi:nucleotide sugar dehydrogenase
MPNKVVIVGYGYVGKAYHKVFPDAMIYDPAFEDSCEIVDVNTNDLAIVCVPTPSLEDGSCDISIVEETIAWLETPLILIKSTIPPGTTAYLKKKYKKRICHSPEYVGEGGYYVSPKYLSPTDVLQHPFMIIGGDPKDRSDILDFFKPVFGPEKFYYQVDETTSELIKYMENSWIAMKVAFCNEFFEIAKRFDVDYDTLREGWLLDPRVERPHTAVFRDKRGFNTKCIPKDILAIVDASTKFGYVPEILKQVLDSNKKFRKEE